MKASNNLCDCETEQSSANASGKQHCALLFITAIEAGCQRES
jgi:hypothetical protein